MNDPVALTPNFGCALWLVPADATEVPIRATSIAAASATTPTSQYLRFMGNLL